MTLDQLKYFLEAAKFEHVGKAARSVHISPSAVSTAILALEDELKCQLFERQGKRVSITQDGKYLKEQVVALFEQINSIRHFLQGEKVQIQGSYRLAASHFLTAPYLAKAWFEIQNEHSGVLGEICSMNTAVVINDILKGSLDFGLCFSPLNHPDLKYYKLHTGHLFIALGKHHPLLQSKKAFKLSSLSMFPATIHKSAPGVDICETHPNFEKYGIKPLIVTQFDSDDIAIEKLKNSHSWSLLPDLVIQSNKNLVMVPHPKEWAAPYSVSLVTRNHRREDVVYKMLKAKLENIMPKL